MKKLMILGASKLQVPAIKRAKEMGVYTIVLDMNPDSIGFKFADIYEVISTIDKEKVLESAIKHKIDGILTIASDRPILTIAYVANVLGLNSVSEETALRATNKNEMRTVLKQNDVPIPHFLKVNKIEELLTHMKILKYPLIFKPEDNSGSRGITLVKKFNSNDLIEAFLYAKKNSYTGNVMIEEYMDGPEVSVESITIDNKTFIIAITDKKTTGSPHFVEMSHSQPSILDTTSQKKIIDVTIQTIKAINIVNGPSHTEIILTSNGPKVVEIGARLGGDNITSHLVPLSTGVDMVKAVIDLALGNYPDINKKISRGSSIKYFDFKEGKVKKIINKISLGEQKNLIDYNVALSIGQNIKPIKSSSERIGYVICDGIDAIDAQKNADLYIKKVDVEYF